MTRAFKKVCACKSSRSTQDLDLSVQGWFFLSSQQSKIKYCSVFDCAIKILCVHMCRLGLSFGMYTYLCLPSSATLGLASCCVGQSSSGVLLLAAPVMSRDRCSLDMLKASDWMPRPSSFKVVLALVLPPLQLAGGSMVVLFFLVMLPAPDDDDDDLRLLDGAASAILVDEDATSVVVVSSAQGKRADCAGAGACRRSFSTSSE